MGKFRTRVYRLNIFLSEKEMAEGAKFKDFESLSTAVKQWEESNYVCLYIRSSRSIDAFLKRASNFKRKIQGKFEFYA